ncbi:acyl carrier protein [soil metagenome]
MDRQDILRAIEGVVREVLNDPSVSLDERTEALDVDGWDSLHHVRILLGVEARFGVRFDMEELQDLADVSALVDLTVKHLAAK